MKGLQAFIVIFKKIWLYIAHGPAKTISKIVIILTRSPHQQHETRQILSILEGLNEARRDFLLTQKYYNSVTDNELLDYSMFRMLAAQSKYSYFLSKARALGPADELDNRLLAMAIKKDM